MNRPHVIAVIPARYASTRLPGKPLLEIAGRPMIQHVAERVARVPGLAQVIIATDDARIMEAVEKFAGDAGQRLTGGRGGGAPAAPPIRAMLTAADLASGTDRVAAIADQVPADIYVNVQGDEPLIEPRAIAVALELVTSGRFSMATVGIPFTSEIDLRNPHVVKAVLDRSGRAIYFSRHPIPYSRGEAPAPADYACLRHVGIYVYARDTLLKFRALAPSALEAGEMLEQLRALEHGIPIGIARLGPQEIGPVLGVDTAEDLAKVRALFV